MNHVFRSVLLVFAGLVMSCSPSAGPVDGEDLARWLEAYGSAWEGKDGALVATLFTEDATYRETPYAEPFRGRAEISNYWSSVTADQEAVEFDFGVLSVSGNTGVAEWSARFRSISGDVPVELNGVFVLEFADADQVSSLREWWHVR